MRLDDDTKGVWGIATISGARYLIDFDQHVVVRSGEPDPDGWPFARLRQDGQELTLVELKPCQEGDDLCMLLAGVADDPGVYTYRRSTPIEKIVELSYD